MASTTNIVLEAHFVYNYWGGWRAVRNDAYGSYWNYTTAKQPSRSSLFSLEYSELPVSLNPLFSVYRRYTTFCTCFRGVEACSCAPPQSGNQTCNFFSTTFLIIGATKTVYQSHPQRSFTASIAGVVINLEESSITPSQEIVFLGFKSNTKNRCVYVSEEKYVNIVTILQQFSRSAMGADQDDNKHCGIRKSLYVAIGPAFLIFATSTDTAVRELKSIQRLYDYSNSGSRSWIANIRIWNGKQMVPPPVSFWI